MDEQLASAVTGGPRQAMRAPAPAPPPAAAAIPPPPVPAPSVAAEPRRRDRVRRPGPSPATPVELLELGMVAEADAAVGTASHPRDALTWATMRALLDGRQEAVRTGVEELRALAQRTDDPEARYRYRIQRFWAAFEWGTNEERLDVLDHCRERAYRFDELDWWGNLVLLLAAMGKEDEAVRGLDEAAALVGSVANHPAALDPLTNLIEAAAMLGDPARVSTVARFLKWPEGRVVVVGPGVVCKGSVDRYRALGLAAAGKWRQAEECFRQAEAVHRDLGAGPLLARTLRQASGAGVAA
ncbi:MAG: hypothetical protein ACRD1D_06235 [Acidimicrobiales bacterium]